MAQPGEKVAVTKGRNRYEGVLMPPEKDFIIIKLDNGYNIGVKKPCKVAKIQKRQARKIKKPNIKFNKKNPAISIISTGGTIASRVDYTTGAVTGIIKAEEILHTVPELADFVNIENIHNPFTKMSEDMLPKDWQELAKIVHKQINKTGIKGLVVTHGTDTLGFTAAALSFMLRNLSKPVVLVGSQRSSDRPSSDATMNILCASRAAISDIAEVGICMHGTLNHDYCIFNRGTKVRKMHSSRRDAFRPVNSLPLAKIWPDGKIEKISDYNHRSDKDIKLDAKFEPKVTMLKTYPGAEKTLINYLLSKNYKGLIIEASALGHVPTNINSWIPHIKKAVESGVPVGITTQCLYGRTAPSVYSNLRKLAETGAIFLEDMLPETAYIKLGWVLGHTKSMKKIKEMMLTNYAGEITERSTPETFLY